MSEDEDKDIISVYSSLSHPLRRDIVELIGEKQLAKGGMKPDWITEVKTTV